MTEENFFYLGTLTKPFGLKGELCAFFDVDDCEKYYNLSSVFIDIEGEKIPYIIDKIQYRGKNQFVIKFQDIDIDNVNDFTHADLFLPLSMLPKLTGNKFYFHEVIGFEVVDQRLGLIGNCSGFMELSTNPIMKVTKEEKEILIPVNKDFIVDVDRDNKILQVDTPEGLVELYL